MKEDIQTMFILNHKAMALQTIEKCMKYNPKSYGGHKPFG